MVDYGYNISYMNISSETRNCQNCKKDFIIEPDDLLFYEKIKVPVPTFCMFCRLQRRMTYRNERTLYKRKCDANNHSESIISMYSPECKIPVYDSKYWNGDEWDAINFGIKYDFSVPFFETFKKMILVVPVQSLFNLNGFNSDYSNCTFDSKNCYLNFASDRNEDTAYLYHSIENKNCYDMFGSRKNENCYALLDSERCFNCSHIYLSDGCINSSYLYDCRNCQNCIGSYGLRNAKYFIFNKEYSPEDYKKVSDGLGLSLKSGRKNVEIEFDNLLKKYPRKFFNGRHTANSSGNYINGGENCKICFDIEGPAKDLKYVTYGVTNINSVYDTYAIGFNIENSYEILVGGDGTYNSSFSTYIPNCYNINYSSSLNNCHDCFACIGLRNKQYCILNKQYTKEEYEELVPKIIKHMNDMPYIDSEGRVYKYGEFFPSELSPFCYNETIAQEYFPLTKEQAISQGYKWKDKEERNYTIDIYNSDIPDNINDVNDDITTKIIECAHKGKCNHQCTEAFKIIPEEYQFYKCMNLPLPRLCPNCRHYERLAQRNPMKLWHRTCMQDGCTNEFETSYAPERPEIIYCESCYKKEVY